MTRTLSVFIILPPPLPALQLFTACPDGTETLVGLIDVAELPLLLPARVSAVVVLPSHPLRLREGGKR